MSKKQKKTKEESKNKASKMTSKSEKTRSHVKKNGEVYFKYTGGYHEVTTDAIGKIPGSSVGD